MIVFISCEKLTKKTNISPPKKSIEFASNHIHLNCIQKGNLKFYFSVDFAWFE